MISHPWHEVDPGAGLPAIVNGIIEIPRGSKGKFEIHKPSGLIMLDRVLYSSMHYPAHYGFIPKTLGDDGDPLDILVLCSVDVPPLTLIEARVLGVMQMRDSGKSDEKIIAVANKDIAYDYIRKLEDIPPHTTVELKRFFLDYKTLENKEVLVDEFLGYEAASKIILEALDRFTARFGK